MPAHTDYDARAVTLDEARTACRQETNFSRVKRMLICCGQLSRPEAFTLLGEQWSVMDHIWPGRTLLRPLLNGASRAELDLMMTKEERAAHAQLPERFTVYRGCYAINRRGLSWTIKRELAANFPRQMRFWRPGQQPYLRIGTVKRERVALKLDRGGAEVIAAHVYAISEELLPIRRE